MCMIVRTLPATMNAIDGASSSKDCLTQVSSTRQNGHFKRFLPADGGFFPMHISVHDLSSVHTALLGRQVKQY
jgi:hypothetical protein